MRNGTVHLNNHTSVLTTLIRNKLLKYEKFSVEKNTK